MAYTQADLDNLYRIKASGLRSYEHNGTRTVFASAAEIDAAIAAAEADLKPASSRPRISFAEFDRW